MATDHDAYLERVRKYDPDADADRVKSLVNKLGIALRNRDSSLVSCSDKEELKTVRDGFAKKRLGLDEKHSDEEIMDAINEVCTQMAGDGGQKHRVPFYYLLAKQTGTLDKL